MKKFNITTVGTYDLKGVEKKKYPQVGKLIHFEATEDKKESYVLELNMFPDTKFAVFPDEPKAEQKERASDLPSYYGEEINPDSIPF